MNFTKTLNQVISRHEDLLYFKNLWLKDTNIVSNMKTSAHKSDLIFLCELWDIFIKCDFCDNFLLFIKSVEEVKLLLLY